MYQTLFSCITWVLSYSFRYLLIPVWGVGQLSGGLPESVVCCCWGLCTECMLPQSVSVKCYVGSQSTHIPNCRGIKQQNKWLLYHLKVDLRLLFIFLINCSNCPAESLVYLTTMNYCWYTELRQTTQHLTCWTTDHLMQALLICLCHTQKLIFIVKSTTLWSKVTISKLPSVIRYKQTFPCPNCPYMTLTLERIHLQWWTSFTGNSCLR